MNKRRLIFVCLFAMIIGILPCGSAYSNSQVSRSAKTAYRGTFLDRIIYKKVVLANCGDRTVLVNRFTGEAKYILINNNKEWRPLFGMWK